MAAKTRCASSSLQHATVAAKTRRTSSSLPHALYLGIVVGIAPQRASVRRVAPRAAMPRHLSKANCGSEDEAHLVFAATCHKKVRVSGVVVPREKLCPVTLLIRRKFALSARSVSPAQPLLSLSACSYPVPAARTLTTTLEGPRYRNIKFNVLPCRGGRAGAIARRPNGVLTCSISDKLNREKSSQKRPTDSFQGQGWPLVCGCCLWFRVFLL